MGTAAFAASAGTGEHPVFDRATDRCAVAAAVGEHVLAPLRSKGIQALAAKLLELVAFNVAQLISADQAVGAVDMGRDPIPGQHLAHHALHPLGVVVDLGDVFPKDPPGNVLRWSRPTAAEQLHQHEWLVDVAHTHPLRDVGAEALESIRARGCHQFWNPLLPLLAGLSRPSLSGSHGKPTTS